MLGQWAVGKFRVSASAPPLPNISPLDRASIGNCAVGPMCPGIEVTWSLRNPPLYARPYQIKPSLRRDFLFCAYGLSLTHDEYAGGGAASPAI